MNIYSVRQPTYLAIVPPWMMEVASLDASKSSAKKSPYPPFGVEGEWRERKDSDTEEKI